MPDKGSTKILILGDKDCGKTQLLKKFALKQLADGCIPQWIDENNVNINIKFREQEVPLLITDINGTSLNLTPTTLASILYYNTLTFCDSNIHSLYYDITSHIEINYEIYNHEYYADVKGIVLCFPIDRPDTFKRDLQKWNLILKCCCPKVPFVLVGNKRDLRDDEDSKRELSTNGLEHVMEDSGQVMAAKIKAYGYRECSAKLSEGVFEVFQTVARATLPVLFTTT